MRVNDLKGVLEAWRDAFEKEPRNAGEYLPSFLEKNPSFCFVAEENRKIVGVILGSFNGRVGYLNRLAVKKDFQGQDIASKLIGSAVQALRNTGTTSIFLHCKPNLAPLYENFGFKVDKDNVIMRLKLD